MKQNNPRQSPVHFDGGLFISPEGTADYTAGSLLFLVVVEPFADQISDQTCHNSYQKSIKIHASTPSPLPDWVQ